MKTKHIVSVKNGTIDSGSVRTSEMGASIKILTDGSDSVEVTINSQWLGSSDLLEAAKLFCKLAQVLAAKE